MAGQLFDLTRVLDGLAPTGVGPPRLVSAAAGKALARLRLPYLTPPLGPAATVIVLAEAAAIAAASTALGEAADLRPDHAPRPVELSANLFRDAAPGVLTAEAETLYRGRHSVVVDVKVRDEQPGLVAALVVTQLAARDPAAAHEPARRAS